MKQVRTSAVQALKLEMNQHRMSQNFQIRLTQEVAWLCQSKVISAYIT